MSDIDLIEKYWSRYETCDETCMNGMYEHLTEEMGQWIMADGEVWSKQDMLDGGASEQLSEYLADVANTAHYIVMKAMCS